MTTNLSKFQNEVEKGSAPKEPHPDDFEALMDRAMVHYRRRLEAITPEEKEAQHKLCEHYAHLSREAKLRAYKERRTRSLES